MSVYNQNYHVAILAGGMGSRLKSRTGTLPKPMAPLLGLPVLAHQIMLCKSYGFTKIALLVHYEHEVISEYFGDGNHLGVEITYSIEHEARGTAGALADALPIMDEQFLVLYGDTYLDVDLKKIFEYHVAKGGAATLMVHPNDHPQDSDLVEVDSDLRIIRIYPYPHHKDDSYPNLVNAALYVITRKTVLPSIPATGKYDLAKHTFPSLIESGIQVNAYITPEYIKDMGTPERLDKVERDIILGLPEKLSFRNLRDAVFLDRDGTLNVEVNHLSSPSQLQLLDGVSNAVRYINRSGYLAIGITNQPVVARGEITFAELNSIHARLDNLLGEGNAYLDKIYTCPHHPDKGFDGEVVELKIRCECRKPETGLIDKAVRDLKISRRSSWMIGDTTSDIKAGAQAGLKTILVRTGYAGRDGKYLIKPDYIMPNLMEAVDWIFNGHAKIAKQLFNVTVDASLSRFVLIGGVARSGKSSTAQVLLELLSLLGKVAHIISLDGWLKPVQDRPEGKGVLERYNMEKIASFCKALSQTTTRQTVEVPEYDRFFRSSEKFIIKSIGPEDILILEGVPALLDEYLCSIATLRLFVDVDDAERQQRLALDYAWRNEDSMDLQRRLAIRESDEVEVVRKSALNATHRLKT